MSTYRISNRTSTYYVAAGNPGDAIERATVLYNLPRHGVIAKRES